MHRFGRIDLDDVAGAGTHNTWVAYGTSKLANLLFAFELARRLEATGLATRSVAAHPGWTRSNLAGSGASLGSNRVRRKVARGVGLTFGQSTAGRALPILCAATTASVRSGQYVGPSRLFGLAGPPRVERPSAAARDRNTATRLWLASEEITGVRYSVDSPA